jgi:hypothetical protein
MMPRARLGPTLPRPAWLVLLAGVLAGCAGLPEYKSDLPANLNIKTKLSAPSVLLTAPLAGTFDADMHVISVDSRCQKNYRGSVRLEGAVSVGIPANQPSYLVFEFSGSSAPTRGAASGTYSTLLTPRSGYQYDVDVIYADKMYSITVYERNPRSGARHEVERRPFSACATKASGPGNRAEANGAT